MTEELRRVSAAFRATLPPELHVSSFRVDTLDRTGIPMVQANIFIPGEPCTSGHGYGFTEDEAEVGAWGELCEELHVHTWLQRTPELTASHDELVHSHGARGVVDPLTLCLSAGAGYAASVPLSWVPARRHGSGETVLVPREWVAAYRYQMGGRSPRLITPITNGLGAGFDIAHAVSHGIMELLQRDGNVLNYRALDQGVVVDIDTDEAGDVTGLLAHLRALGIAVTVKLACTDFGISNLYVVGDDRGEPLVPIQVTACGEAAHPDRSRALRKALLEFCGSRARKAATHGPLPLLRDRLPADYYDNEMRVALLAEEGRAVSAMAEWLGQPTATLRARLAPNVFAEHSRVKLSSLPTTDPAATANSVDRLAMLAERLAAQGLDILYVDCSPLDGAIAAVKVIVPGLESETMSYHRIGWRGVRRLRDRRDALIHDRPVAGAQRVMLRPEDEDRAGGPAWFDCAAADAKVDRLYPLYRESSAFAAQLLSERTGEAASPARL